MKRMALILILFFSISAFSQTHDLHDVNYDAPENMAIYDESQQLFQQIYLQYESTVKELEDSILLKERMIRQQEASSAREDERQKSQVALAEALEKQRQEIYSNEIEGVRTQERERLSAEIHNAVSAELNEQFAVIYEEKKNKELEVIVEQKKAEIRAELEPEYDAKMNAKIEKYKELWKQEVFQESGIMTEWIKFIVPRALAGVFVVALAFLLVWIIKKCIQLRKNKKDSVAWQNERQGLVEYHAESYLNKMRKYSGKSTVYDVIEQIREEIDKSSEPEEDLSIKRDAIRLAQQKYESKAKLSIEEYKKLFNDLDAQSVFNNWNSAGDDEEMRNGLCNNFFDNINKYTINAKDALYSNNDKNEVKKMLKTFCDTLKNNSELVKGLSEKEKDEDRKKTLESIAEKYANLAGKFAKGDL